MFENKKFNDIHATRYIASWFNSGGSRYVCDFEDWLMSLGFTAEEARYVWNMATCGKLELEVDAKKFIDELRQTLEDEG